MRTGWTECFACDLTREQQRLCQWVADRARTGVTRIYYQDVAANLGIRDEMELTVILRNMRERLDGIHEMVQWPVVHTVAPYFDIHQDADHIWDSYRRAERTTPQLAEFRSQDATAPCLLDCGAARNA